MPQLFETELSNKDRILNLLKTQALTSKEIAAKLDLPVQDTRTYLLRLKKEDKLKVLAKKGRYNIYAYKNPMNAENTIIKHDLNYLLNLVETKMALKEGEKLSPTDLNIIRRIQDRIIDKKEKIRSDIEPITKYVEFEKQILSKIDQKFAELEAKIENVSRKNTQKTFDHQITGYCEEQLSKSDLIEKIREILNNTIIDSLLIVPEIKILKELNIPDLKTSATIEIACPIDRQNKKHLQVLEEFKNNNSLNIRDSKAKDTFALLRDGEELLRVIRNLPNDLYLTIHTDDEKNIEKFILLIADSFNYFESDRIYEEKLAEKIQARREERRKKVLDLLGGSKVAKTGAEKELFATEKGIYEETKLTKLPAMVYCEFCGYKISKPFPKDNFCPKCKKFLPELYDKGKDKIELSKGEYIKLLGITSVERTELYCSNNDYSYLLELTNNLDFIASGILDGELDRMLLVSEEENLEEKCQFYIKDEIIYLVYGKFPDKKGKWLLEQMSNNFSELVKSKDVNNLEKFEKYQIQRDFKKRSKFILKEYQKLQEVFSDQELPYKDDLIRIDYVGLSSMSIGVMSLLIGEELNVELQMEVDTPEEEKEMKESMLAARIEAIAANTQGYTGAIPRWIAVKCGFQKYRFISFKKYRNDYYLCLISEGNIGLIEQVEAMLDSYIKPFTAKIFSGDLKAYYELYDFLKKNLEKRNTFPPFKLEKFESKKKKASDIIDLKKLECPMCGSLDLKTLKERTNGSTRLENEQKGEIKLVCEYCGYELVRKEKPLAENDSIINTLTDTAASYKATYKFPKFIFKICMIGSTGVGKTSIAKRLCFGTYHVNTKITIGIDFYTYDLPILANGEKTFVRISVWEYGGQEQFKKLFPHYINGANGIVFVFDLSEMKSLFELDWWYNNLKEYYKGNLPKILIGNKLDLIINENKGVREIESNVNKFLKNHENMDYMKTSAKENINIQDIFKKISKEILHMHKLDYERIL